MFRLSPVTPTPAHARIVLRNTPKGCRGPLRVAGFGAQWSTLTSGSKTLWETSGV